MQKHEAFKLGFLARCVEEGLSPEQTYGLAKQAEGEGWLPGPNWLAKQIFGPVQTAAETGKSVADLAKSTLLPLGALAVGVPASAGALAAYLQNNATDVDGNDVNDAKRQELLETYRRMSDQLKRTKELRDYKQTRKQTGRVFL